MKIPMTWLNDFVDLGDVDIKTFMDRMTMSGSKAEGFEALGADITGVVTGRVLSIDKHPGADKLLITKIDTGRAEPVQIVTAATNLKAGDYVPVALDGAVLAGNKVIAAGELRGELSDGMLCSIEELGYDRDSYPEAPEDGIYVFAEPVELGADPAPILELREDVVEFELTSNRPDCFSVLGIAREAAATFNRPLKAGEINPGETAGNDVGDFIKVRIDNPELCPRYCARVVRNVKIGPSPQWLRHRLTAAGLRPINNIVDVTNYVMLELGQPMHAFDIGCVRGGEIIVRNARPGEVLTTLDGTARSLDPSMLVIADKERGLAVAGVMGGEDSMITGVAGAVLLESANFNGINVRLTAKKLGMRTDSSAKFEKRLDPNLALTAINRAAELIEQIGAGSVVKGAVDAYPGVREPWEVRYNGNKINALLGLKLTDAEIEGFLARLGISAKDGAAKIPTFRPDLIAEADIAEEVARLYGYDNIETTLAGSSGIGKKNDRQLLRDRVREAMSALGYHEALSFAFESPAVFDRLRFDGNSGLRRAAVIKNPLGEEYGIMRTTTVPAMLTSLALNYNRRNEEAALYEIARVYLPKSVPMTELPDELDIVTMGLYGNRDFYDIKGAAEYVAGKIGADPNKTAFVREQEVKGAPHATDLPFLHPGRKACIAVDGVFAGFIGEVHPAVREDYGLDTRAYVCALYLDALFARAEQPAYNPLPRFPAMRRDIALITDNAHTVGDILAAIRETGGEFLEEAAFFDAYTGAGIEPGKRSLAFSMHFRHPARTLTDAETSETVQAVLDALKKRFGAVLRG
ncbi:MAG: phenylalanine--tRNA ligase subunit beta [Defluviitaleaceae bacterium]|nr:phenylalanine--tRNA ligase subunit beta [Defluviitaleaceae bacterium]MCL2835134.1 phenylalanine--tRNA ligase subunit beta [Defluviitaleaceae bacterium]